MADTPPNNTPEAPRRSRRAWWQYVIGIGFILAGVGSYVLRWAEKNTPDWYLRLATVDTVPLRLPPGTKTVETVPVERGALSGFNVLLITMDTTRADRLAYYGNDKIETPALDKLAAGGLYFSRALTTAPTTLPSHASILTGLWPFHHGARLNGTTMLTEDKLTIAEILRDRGYATAAMVSAFVLDHTYGVAQGFGVYDDEVTHFDDAPLHREAERRGDLTTDRALEWLKSKQDAPFFLWVHYYDAHGPYEPPGEFAKKYETMRYDGEIAFIDSQIARLSRHLSDAGLREKTLVVVVGDHGEGLGQHREWTHGLMLYDPTMHVPFILNCPGKLPAGLHVAREVSVVDVLPTVLSMLSVDIPVCDGVDLTKPWPADRSIYGETSEGFNQHGLSPLLCVWNGRYKYIYGPVPELYDISADMDETRDLAAADAQTAEQLKQQLQRLYGKDLAKAMNVESSDHFGSEEREKLAALGYISAGLSSIPKSVQLPDPKSAMKIINRMERILAVQTDAERRDAIAKMEELAQEHPDFYSIYKYLGDLYYREQEYFKAQQVIEKALEIYPDVPSNLLLLARTQYLTGDFEQAVETYKHTATVSSEKFTPLAELGRLLLERRRFAEGVEQLEAAFLLRPNDGPTIEVLVLALQRLGRTDEAIGMLEGRLAQDASLVQARCALAQLRAAQGRTVEAMALVEAGKAQSGDLPDYANVIALILTHPEHGDSARLTEAVSLAERACRETRNENPRFLHTLATAYARAGRTDEAIQAAERAMAIATEAQMPRVANAIKVTLDHLRARRVD